MFHIKLGFSLKDYYKYGPILYDISELVSADINAAWLLATAVNKFPVHDSSLMANVCYARRDSVFLIGNAAI